MYIYIYISVCVFYTCFVQVHLSPLLSTSTSFLPPLSSRSRVIHQLSLRDVDAFAGAVTSASGVTVAQQAAAKSGAASNQSLRENSDAWNSCKVGPPRGEIMTGLA